MKKFTFFVIILHFVMFTKATTYYVDNTVLCSYHTGTINCVGTDGPFLTIQDALNYVATNGASGDVVYVTPSTYVENLVWPNFDGITLTSDPNNWAIVDGGWHGSVIRIDPSLYSPNNC